MIGFKGPRHRYDRNTLLRMIREEPFDRFCCSFYRYARISEPDALRDELFEEWGGFGVLGRVYLAHEGINAQISVPEPQKGAFREWLEQQRLFRDIPLRPALEHRNDAFLKLRIKVRPKIVADGLDDHEIDPDDGPQHLDPESFHEALEREDSIVVDMRNHYESEVGHFQGAVTPRTETFREELPRVKEALSGQEDKQILLYCTGGIRCEKAGAYLRREGFENVAQLDGGIIEYARMIKKKGVSSKFIGKNFVFDERLGERVTEDVIAHCHQCGAHCDRQVNCRNEGCNLLFIQCEACAEEWEGCCTPDCREMIHLPEAERKRERKEQGSKERFNKGKKGRQKLAERIRDANCSNSEEADTK